MFFVVCMALLMLSLIKSMLVVKLLHHDDKDVRQMSLSACLLDRYGSAGREVTASALTPIRTLEPGDPSEGEPPASVQQTVTNVIVVFRFVSE